MAEPRMEPPDSNISTKMNAKDLRIVFMGTPEFAVPSLRALVRSGYNVVGVVTTPDKPCLLYTSPSPRD